MKRWLLNSKMGIWLKRVVRGNYLYCFWVFPIDQRKIVVSRNDGNGYGGNAKYIVEEMLNRDMDYDIVWLLRKGYSGTSLPAEIRFVPTNSFKALYELATAKVWIDNTRKYFYPPKRSNQFYLQTWHSSFGIKYLEQDANLNKTYMDVAKRDGRMTDLMVAGSQWREMLYKRSFWYDGEVMLSGTPRLDVLMGDTFLLKKKVCRFYGIPLTHKLIIYAPTFREDSTFNYWSLKGTDLTNALSEKFGGEWTMLFRLHPKVADLQSGSLDSQIIDATNYDDMQELLAAADVLITDYSSSMFDVMIAEKKCFLYCTDKVRYQMDERQLYFHLGQLPFDLSESLSELINHIESFEQSVYNKRIKEFHNLVQLKEQGNASKRIVDRLIAETNKE